MVQGALFCAKRLQSGSTIEKKDKLSVGDDPHLPEAVKARYVCDVVTGSYKVCIDQSGAIGSVSVIQGIAGADDVITGTVRQWRYKPQAIPICLAVCHAAADGFIAIRVDNLQVGLVFTFQ